ncbi:MAG: drug/metabolite exporter YedA [Polyangiaceae bacterium]|nr:drug/metabolite exporter YedA [Polyangiaceae bacterium]
MATTSPIPVVAASRFPGPVQASERLVPLALLAVYIIWGSTYLALKWMVEGLPPLVGAGARYLVAGAVLYAFSRLRGAPRPTRKQWLASIPAGAGLFLVGNGFVSIAQGEVKSSFAAIVCAATPLMMAVFGRLAGERTSSREVVGLVLGFAGVAVMTTKELAGASLGAGLLLLAPVGWSLGSLAAKKLDQPPGLLGAATQMIAGGVATATVGFARGESLPAGEVPLRSVGAFFYLVIAGSLIAFSAYSYLLRNTRSSVATSYAYVNPVIAVALGVFLGGETLSLQMMLGGALVVAGVVVVVRARASGQAVAVAPQRDPISET